MSYLDANEEARRKIKKNKRDNDTSSFVPRTDITKYVDVLSANRVLNSTGSLTLLNGVASGNDFYQRINRAIVGKELKLKLAFSMVGALGWWSHDSARVIVLWDTDADTIPTIADVLLDVNASNVTGTNNFSGKNINNKDRFIFLVDRNFALPAFTVTTVGQIASTNTTHSPNNNDWAQDINIKLDGLVTRFNGTGYTETDISSGALYLLMLGGVAAGSTNWRITTTSRFSFYDV